MAQVTGALGWATNTCVFGNVTHAKLTQWRYTIHKNNTTV